MDGKSSCGFRKISAPEVDFSTPPEEMTSMSSRLPAADPSSLRKALSESFARSNGPQPCEGEHCNRISTEINIPMETAGNNDSQCSSGAAVTYSASPAGSSGTVGFHGRPHRGSTSAAADSTTPKVGKKRSRASRRAPTTVLTTDTSNFRAMVQEFTGIPHSPLARRGIDFLGVPRPAGFPSFLHRPFPVNSYPPPFAPTPNSSMAPPSSYFMQAQRPPGDWIPLPLPVPASNTFSNAQELGLSVVLPDLVSSDVRPHARRTSSQSFSSEESAVRNPPRPDRGTMDSWIIPSLQVRSPNKDNEAQ